MSNRYPQPEDFYSEAPPQRIIGSETEYNVTDTQLPPYSVNSLRVVSDLAVSQQNYDRRREHLINGGKIYKDTNNVVEYVTPEVRTAAELAKHEYAGCVLLADSCREIGADAAYRRSGYDHLAYQPASAGYHENYLVPVNEKNAQYYKYFMESYFATRVIWAGAGIIGKSFRFSQKGHGLRVDNYTWQQHTIHGQKEMVTIKPDESLIYHAETRINWSRLENRSGDPNMSPWVTMAKFAVTSLVMRLVEYEAPEKLEKFMFRNGWPSIILKAVSEDLSLSKTYRTRQHKKRITAIEHQQAIVETALALGKHIKLPLEEQIMGEEVYNMCDQLKHVDIPNGALGQLPRQLDWAAKLASITEAGTPVSEIHRSNFKAVYKDLTWERVRPDRHIIPAVFGAEMSKQYNPARLRKYLLQPPSDTRAKYRALGQINKTDIFDPYGYLLQ